MDLTENQFQVLKDIKEGAESGSFQMAKPKTPVHAQLVGKGLIEYNTDPKAADENGKVPFRPTTEGMNYLMENQHPDMNPVAASDEMNTAAPAPTATPNFGIATVPMPSVTRGGGSTKYPVEKLTVGQSLFVEVGPEIKNPSKKFGSVATNANKRFNGEHGGDVRKFTVRTIKDGAPWGEQFAGKSGVAVFRTE